MPLYFLFNVVKYVSGFHVFCVVLLAGIVGAVLLALICVIAVLMWCLSRHKGSYTTNETDDDDDMDDEDEEPFCSDMVLQTNQPLTVDEDEESRIET